MASRISNPQEISCLLASAFGQDIPQTIRGKKQGCSTSYSYKDSRRMIAGKSLGQGCLHFYYSIISSHCYLLHTKFYSLGGELHVSGYHGGCMALGCMDRLSFAETLQSGIDSMLLSASHRPLRAAVNSVCMLSTGGRLHISVEGP